MFFRKLSISGSGDSKRPPEYNENDDLNHLPTVFDECISTKGPTLMPINSLISDQSSEARNVPPSVVSLKSFKKHNPDNGSFLYNPFDESQNPVKTIHESNNLRVELILENDTVFLPGLKEDLKSHTSLMDHSRSQVDEEELANYRTSLSGKLVLTVKSTSVVINDLKVRLNGYSNEYVCVLEKKTDAGCLGDNDEDDEIPRRKQYEKTVKVLTDSTDGKFTFLKPFVTDEVTGFKKTPTLLSKGTYIVPFSFILDPYNYHSSFESAVGSTSYRVEAFMSTLSTSNISNTSTINHMTLDTSGKYENVFLTHKCSIIKTLSPSSLLKYESITSQGSYKEGFLDYDFFISSKLIELNCPFHCQFSFKTKPQATINRVTLSLVQMALMPCIKEDGVTPVKKSYIQSNTFVLGHYSPPRDKKSDLVLAKFEDLQIHSRLNDDSRTGSKILPYYCEESRLLLPRNDRIEKRFKLKVTHFLKISLNTTLNYYPGSFVDNSRRINMNFKIPVMIIDKNMGSSLHLPPYEPPMVSKSMSTSLDSEYNWSPNSSLQCQSLNSFTASPPSYDSLSPLKGM